MKMKRILTLLGILPLLAVSCLEYPNDVEEPVVVTDPSLTVSCTVVGSYSAEFTCGLTPTDRIFIGGGFYYSTSPDFKDASKAAGMVIDNHLSCTVTDLELDRHYYVKAYLFDVLGTLESGVISFDSPTFQTDMADFHLTYQGGKLDLTVVSNTEFLVYSDADWITGTDTRSGSERHRQVYVQRNTSFYARSATLILSSPDNYIRKKFLVLQDAAPLTIPDAAFKAYLLEHYDEDHSAEIELVEVPAVTEIRFVSDQVRSLEGIAHFPNLQTLVCRGEALGQLLDIDLSGNPRLTTLDLANNQIKTLDIACCPNLKVLDCSNNRLSALNVSKNEPLEYLDCRGNELSSLDLSENISLNTILCDRNRLASLKSTRSSALETLSCSGNALTSLELSINKGLKHLTCADNQLKALKVTSNEQLTYLDCGKNELSELVLRRNVMLDTLLCPSNVLSVLDLRFNPRLQSLDCQGNRLKTLDLSGNLQLASLYASNNPLTTLDLSMLTQLHTLVCLCPELALLHLVRSQNIEGVTVNRSTECLPDHTVLRYVDDLIQIADPVFLQYLLKYHDSDGDGHLSGLEADKITSLNLESDQIETLDGIEYLSGLKYLKCEGSLDADGKPLGKLTSLDLSKNRQLEQVLCGRNRISTLNISDCFKLKTLWCFDNQLTALNVSACQELADLNCEGNQIQSLDFSANPKLISLDCAPMSDADGRTLLQDVTVCTQIDYINGDRHSRSNTNIPFTTALYYNFTPVNPLPTPFMFNYNALNFAPETRRLSNSSGASWNRTLSMQSAGFSYLGDHLHISRGASIRYGFSSPQANPFNRTGQDDLTIIAKVKGENSAYYSIFSCCGSASTDSNYRFQEGGGTDNTQYFSILDNRAYGYAPGLMVNTLPNIIIVRARNGYIWLESYTDHISSAMMPVEWGGLSKYVSFFYGGSSGKYWQGDFYWMFLANRALSDSEIKQVINYNGI